MRKKLLVSIVLLVVMIASMGMVNAASGTVKLTVSNNTAAPGETFKVTFSATCEEGINGVDTKFSYDTDKLELVSASVVDVNNWSSLGSGQDITVISNSAESIKTANIYAMTFKVKETVTAGSEAKIETEAIKLDSDASENSTATIGATSTKVAIKAAASGTETPSSGSESTPTGQSSGGTRSTSKKADTTVAGTKLPSTGAADTIMMFIAGVSIIVAVSLIILIATFAMKHKEVK